MTFRQLQYKLSGRGYKQQKFGITYHFAWLLGLAWGIQDNFTKTDYRLEDHSKIKCFDAPYLKTLGSDNGGWVRYQTLPASMHGHHVNIVYHDIEVNSDGSRVEFPSGDFHCVNCQLMGNQYTFERYSCLGNDKIDWREECGCSQCKKGNACTWATVSDVCHGGNGEKLFRKSSPTPLLIHYRRDDYVPTEEDLDKYMAIRTEAGWWKRKSLQNEAGMYSLERKWIKPR